MKLIFPRLSRKPPPRNTTDLPVIQKLVIKKRKKKVFTINKKKL